jgi:hypothetical protein
MHNKAAKNRIQMCDIPQVRLKSPLPGTDVITVVMTRKGVCTMSTVGVEKQAWIDEYARRILQVWLSLQAPLGVDGQYSQQVKNQLDEYFDDPLKRGLIEMTYKG